MARIAFVWELGGGFGHLVRHRGLIKRLALQGHRVVFHAVAEARARQVFADLAVEVHPAPRGATRRPEVISHPNSFAEVLWNSGYAEIESVAGRMAHWRRVFLAERPDVVIADYAPSAVVACHTLGLRCIAAGNGFYTPPRVCPLPPYRRVYDGRVERAAASEQKLLGVFNLALRQLGLPGVSTVAEAIVPPETFLMTFPEFDPMGQARGPAAEYLGAWPNPGFGIGPAFGEHGRKLFCYLDVNKIPKALFPALASTDASILLVVKGEKPEFLRSLENSNVNVISELANLTLAAQVCDAGLTSGSLNATAALLLAGKPVLAIPANLEQYLNAARLERLGAGLSAPYAAPGNLDAKLGALLQDHDLRRGAGRFARRHAALSRTAALEQMLSRLDLPSSCPD